MKEFQDHHTQTQADREVPVRDEEEQWTHWIRVSTASMGADPLTTRSSVQLSINKGLTTVQEPQGLITVGMGQYSGNFCLNIMMIEDSYRVFSPNERYEPRAQVPKELNGAKKGNPVKQSPVSYQCLDVHVIRIGVISMDDSFPTIHSWMVLEIEDECVNVREARGNILTCHGETSNGDATALFLIVEDHEDWHFSAAKPM